jgi:hypothetical protein
MTEDERETMDRLHAEREEGAVRSLVTSAARDIICRGLPQYTAYPKIVSKKLSSTAIVLSAIGLPAWMRSDVQISGENIKCLPTNDLQEDAGSQEAT